MKRLELPFFLLFISLIFTHCTQPGEKTGTAKASVVNSGERPEYALVIHGGAGTILKENMTPEKEKAIKEALNEALDRGDIEEGDRIIKRYVEMLKDAYDNPELTLHEILGRNIERYETRH